MHSALMTGRSSGCGVAIPRCNAFQIGVRAMGSPVPYASDIAFSPAVKAAQLRKGSRKAYARTEENGSWDTIITPELRSFLAAQTSMFLATANAEGQPYVQHRGGPPGFLRVLDDKTIAFVDYTGNRQYITTGN